MAVWLVLFLVLAFAAAAFLFGNGGLARASLVVAAAIFLIIALSVAAFLFVDFEAG